LPEITTISFLRDESGHAPTLTVKEVRKGTMQEVQRIIVTAGSNQVNGNSSFILEFNGDKTGVISAAPTEGLTCLGSPLAKQIITSSTEDTTKEGGDYSVSTDTSFSLIYGRYESAQIYANRATCEDTAFVIASELQTFPPLKRVDVSGYGNGLGNNGCIWVITFLSVTGIPELLKGTLYPCVCLIDFYT
jgi:hypothetical protein